MRTHQGSRLSRTTDKQNKKQTMIFGFAILILIVVLVQFGPLLINAFGNLVYSLRGAEKSTQLVGEEILPPPTLIGIPNATPSAELSFSGNASSEDGTVEIYVNDSLEDEVNIDKDMTFEVNDLSLSSGTNTIKARHIVKDQASAFSKNYKVSYIKDKPKLDVSFPSNDASFTRADKKITVRGTTDAENTITVNSFQAIVDGSGAFSYLIELPDGDSTIIVVAKNPAGATEQKEIKVKYQP